MRGRKEKPAKSSHHIGQLQKLARQSLAKRREHQHEQREHARTPQRFFTLAARFGRPEFAQKLWKARRGVGVDACALSSMFYSQVRKAALRPLFGARRLFWRRHATVVESARASVSRHFSASRRRCRVTREPQSASFSSSFFCLCFGTERAKPTRSGYASVVPI